MLKENVLTFYLRKVSIKCRVSIRKLLNIRTRKITSFLKEIFSIYFEHNINLIESKFMSLKIPKVFHPWNAVLRAVKGFSISKFMFPLALKIPKKFSLAFLSH